MYADADYAATRFWSLLSGMNEAQICRDQRTITIAEIVNYCAELFRYKNPEIFQRIKQLQLNDLSLDDVKTMIKYYYISIPEDIRRNVVASLLRCFDISMTDEDFRQFEDGYTSPSLSKSNQMLLISQALDGSMPSTAGIIDDARMMRFLITQTHFALEHASARLRDDKDVMLFAVKQTSGLALQFASQRLQDDPEIVIAAVRYDGYALQYASYRLKDNKTVAAAALFIPKAGVLSLVSDRLRDDSDIVSLAVSEGTNLEAASMRLRGDKNIVLKAVTSQGSALAFAHPTLRDDEEVVQLAVSSAANALGYASIRLRDNKRIVMMAVRFAGYVLPFVSRRLRDDEEVVLAAKTNYPSALKSASDRLIAKFDLY